MKNSKIISIWKEKNLGFYFSIFGSLFIFVLNIINTISTFSLLFLDYAIVSLLFALARIVIRYVNKDNTIYLFGTLFSLLIIVPLTIAMVLTIVEKEKVQYIFYWMIYAYALYGTIKIIIAIKTNLKKNKTEKEIVLGIFSMISALFTIELVEFALISTFGNGNNLFIIQFLYQGFVVLIVIISIIYLMLQYLKLKNRSNV